jgi:hypothetical protein
MLLMNGDRGCAFRDVALQGRLRRAMQIGRVAWGAQTRETVVEENLRVVTSVLRGEFSMQAGRSRCRVGVEGVGER